MKRLLTSFFVLFFSTLSYAQQTLGLFFNKEQSENGYTLFSNNETSYLIDNCGFVINTWISDYKSNNGLCLTKDGDLLRMGQIVGSAMIGGEGGIIERFSWEGNLEWSYQIANEMFVVHHDMLLMPNGNILITVWEKITSSHANQIGRVISGDFFNEQIWEIQPLPNNQANIVWRWSAIDHIIQNENSLKPDYGTIAEHPELIDLNYITPELTRNHDWLHINSIDYNEELDQIIVCSRNNSEVYIIDHSTTVAEASGHSGGLYGKGGDILYRYGNPEAFDQGSSSDRILFQPHDASWIESGEYKGNFLIFNNKFIENTRSKIQIWNNPAENGHYHFLQTSLFGSQEELWSYDEVGFYSSRMSSAQMLSNGNILTVEGTTGEISEITQSKNRVWKYINPVNKNGGPGIQSGTPQFNSLFKTIRYSDSFVGLVDKDLTPGDPVELLPDDIWCQIFISTSIEKDKVSNKKYKFFNDQLTLFVDINFSDQVLILDVFGRILMQAELNHFDNKLNLTNLRSGIYYVYSRNFESFSFYKN